MGLTTAWRDVMAAAVIGGSYTAYNNANSYLGVGDSTTAFANSQTDIQAATNRLKKAMDATFPTRAANALTFQSTFATSDANFAWQEWAVFNGGTAFGTGTMFNRVQVSLGTKTSASSWQLNVTITLNVP